MLQRICYVLPDTLLAQSVGTLAQARNRGNFFILLSQKDFPSKGSLPAIPLVGKYIKKNPRLIIGLDSMLIPLQPFSFAPTYFGHKRIVV